MLVELRIRNFAIINDLNLEFGPGLTILTGETGAGKSIIIDAVESLLGVRADSSLVRQNESRASVEGTFRIPDLLREQIHTLLQEEDLLDDPDYVILTREIRVEGRNVVRVNGRTVNLQLLKQLGEMLIDLHGQSEHLSLLRVGSHLGLLDRFAEDDSARKEYRSVYCKWQGVQKEITRIRETLRDAARQQELLRYQAEEISTAQLKTGEERSSKQSVTALPTPRVSRKLLILLCKPYRARKSWPVKVLL